MSPSVSPRRLRPLLRMGVATVVSSAAVLLATAATSSAATYSLWPANPTPATVDSGDAAAVELGVKVRFDSPGKVTAIRFYKATRNKGTHTGSVWSSSGTRLATGTFSGETASGWQTLTLASPATVVAGSTYTVSYYAPRGYYSVNEGGFASAGVDNGPLHALRNGVSGGNGVYRYGSGGVAPTSSYQSSNYWVDLAFVPDSTTPPPADTTAPTAPATLTALATSSSSIDLSWSASTDAVGVTGYTVYRGSTAVGTTSGSTRTFTDTGLTASTTYSYTVAARDAAGNVSSRSPLASATTTAGTTPPPSGWPNASNTGVPAGTALTVVNGDVTLSTAGMTYDAKDVRGRIYVTANNVRITRTRATGGVSNRARGLVMEDVEVGPTSGTGGDDGIGFSDYTCRRCNVHNFSDGLKISGNVLIEDSWVHDLYQKPGDHNDAMQNYAGSGDVTLRHNSIDGDPYNTSEHGNAAIFSADFPTGTITIDGNLLRGGHYTLQMLDNATYVATNNVFVRGDYTYGTHRISNAALTTWSNNTFSDNGAQIAK